MVLIIVKHRVEINLSDGLGAGRADREQCGRLAIWRTAIHV
jgi:hypothetical protein